MAKPPKHAPPADPPKSPGQMTPPGDGSHGSSNPWHPLSASIDGKAASALDEALGKGEPERDAGQAEGASGEARRTREGWRRGK